jgi:hypothetical protein
MQPIEVTKHATSRLRQRGVRAAEVRLVMTYGDIEIPAHNGCRFVRLSHAAVASLYERARSTREIDRARRLMLLIGPTGNLITVLKCDPQRRVRVPEHRRA